MNNRLTPIEAAPYPWNFFGAAHVDAWIEPCASPIRGGALKVDDTLDEGRFGREEASPVRFRLSLKRAELIVTLPTEFSADQPKQIFSREPKRSIEVVYSPRVENHH